jgi:hypothetical protein
VGSRAAFQRRRLKDRQLWLLQFKLLVLLRDTAGSGRNITHLHFGLRGYFPPGRNYAKRSALCITWLPDIVWAVSPALLLEVTVRADARIILLPKAYCCAMPAAMRTASHRLYSSPMNFPNSSGPEPWTITPIATRRARTFSSLIGEDVVPMMDCEPRIGFSVPVPPLQPKQRQLV